MTTITLNNPDQLDTAACAMIDALWPEKSAASEHTYNKGDKAKILCNDCELAGTVGKVKNRHGDQYLVIDDDGSGGWYTCEELEPVTESGKK